MDHQSNSSGDAQSAAMPSPFTPIAEYAFLSDCHTGALVAPDGGVDWLCVPRFDAPSVFASLLDREAGTFRLGPFGINVPSARRYEPGTNVLETTWKTPSGWVRRPRRVDHGADPRAGHGHAAHTAARRRRRRVTCWCAPPSASTGRVAMELVCEPVFDYGRTAGEWSLVEGTNHAADAVGADVTIRLRTDMALGVEAHRVRARHLLRAGERLYCALSWDAELAAPEDEEEANELHLDHGGVLAVVARPGADPRSPVEGADPTIGAGDQGPHVHADRGDGGRAHDVAAGDTRRRAELGLPLHLDARLDVHPAGAALAQPRLGGRRVHAVRRRPRSQRRRRAADHVRHRRAS